MWFRTGSLFSKSEKSPPWIASAFERTALRCCTCQRSLAMPTFTQAVPARRGLARCNGGRAVYTPAQFLSSPEVTPLYTLGGGLRTRVPAHALHLRLMHVDTTNQGQNPCTNRCLPTNSNRGTNRAQTQTACSAGQIRHFRNCRSKQIYRSVDAVRSYRSIDAAA